MERTGKIDQAIKFYGVALANDAGFESASQSLLKLISDIKHRQMPASTIEASLDELFSRQLFSGRTEATARYLKDLWDMRLLQANKEIVLPRWAYWLVRYLTVAGVPIADFESTWAVRFQDKTVDESVRNSPWLSRVRDAYLADLPVVLNPAQARDLISPWSASSDDAIALSKLLRSVGDAYLEKGNQRAALTRYALAWSSAGSWKAALYLTELVQRAPADLDADGHIIDALAAASASADMAPTDQEGWRDVSRYYVLLAQDHEKRATSDSALVDWEKAAAAHEKANSIAFPPTPAPGLYSGLGEAYLKAKQPIDAFASLMTAAEQYMRRGRLEEATQEARLLLSAATLQARLGNERAAETSFSQARDLLEKLGDLEGQALAYRKIASAQINRGAFSEARANLNRARDFFTAVGDKAGLASTFIDLARTYKASGYLKEARDLLSQSLMLTRAMQNLELEASALVVLADLEKQEGQIPQALNHVDSALALFESFPLQPDYTESSLEQQAYEMAIDLRMGLRFKEPRAVHQAAAFVIHEKAQARRLRQVLVNSGVLPAKLHQSERLDTLLRPTIRSLVDIQALLEPDTILLKYALGKERSYLWALTQRRFTVYELPSRERVQEIIRSINAKWSRPYEGTTGRDQGPEFFQLSQWLLAPLSEYKGRRLIIVPDGAIQYLPFAALIVPESHHLVIEEYEVVTLPSASALVDLRYLRDRPSPSNLLAVLAGVPSSRNEAEQVAAAVSEFQVGGVFLNLKADRKWVTGSELAKFRIVHFATHGLLDADTPSLSSLSLNLPANLKADRLDLKDVYNLELKADLIVLSGSGAVLGGDFQSEGLVGLSRGFQFAGAKRVMLSLWSVDDRATSELMRSFYRSLIRDKQPPATALRQAQLLLQRNPRWINPHFWAPFILQGF